MLASNVKVIQPKKLFNIEENAKRILRVAGYARVSTGRPEQKTSFESQQKHYKELVAKHSDWIDVGLYADEGITATSMRKRKQFLKMIQDAKDGKIDRIIVKSVSRFARNTVDCLATVEELTALGVDVFFELQNLSSLQDSKTTRMQLTMYEIVKDRLLQALAKSDDGDRTQFNRIWESCSEMGTYVQEKYNDEKVFCDDQWLGGDNFDLLFEEKTSEEKTTQVQGSEGQNPQEPKKLNSIDAILNKGTIEAETKSTDGKSDTFQPIIDFSNFLLIVLKITRILKDPTFKVDAFNLDDKELLNEFNGNKIALNAGFAKAFGYNLLKAKFFLDNYIVHHSNEDDTLENNPWKLQYWHREGNRGKTYSKNLCEDDETQDTLVQLLSLFEVSFTARQRKNYLFYCLLYLFKNANRESTFKQKYRDFLEGLADKYFKGVYLEQSCLNEINTPQPGSFDEKLLKNGDVNISIDNENTVEIFDHIYGDGTEKSKGIPLFIFNYLDYRLWKAYLSVRGSKEGSKERQELFNKFGCNDFGFDIFKVG